MTVNVITARTAASSTHSATSGHTAGRRDSGLAEASPDLDGRGRSIHAKSGVSSSEACQSAATLHVTPKNCTPRARELRARTEGSID